MERGSRPLQRSISIWAAHFDGLFWRHGRREVVFPHFERAVKIPEYRLTEK